MQCHVLGASGSRPGNGEPCSGYLVSTGATTVLVDCGFGVVTALTGMMNPRDLDAVFITHRHLDHCIDVLGLHAILRRTNTSVAVHAAAEVAATTEAMITPHRRDQWRSLLPMTTMQPGDSITVGDLSVAAHASDHPVPTVSLRFTDATGAVLAYSSDSAGGGDLAACVADADVALVEASWQEADDDRFGDGHMTARRAGEVGRDGRVGQLVLTHLRPHLDPEMSRTEAATAHDGPVLVARAGMVFDVAVRGDGHSSSRTPATSPAQTPSSSHVKASTVSPKEPQ